jgi:YidC/Oxa1 family membrane protein insertase
MNPFSAIYTLLEPPIINVVVAIYHVLYDLHIPYPLGFAIILMTAIVRLLLYPVTAAQLKTTRKMQELAPHLSKIKEKHKGDTKRQQEETMALYKAHNINPASGCLPGLVQIVILVFGLYPALLKVINLTPKQTVEVINQTVYFPFLRLNTAWDTHFFGLSIGKTPQQLFTALGTFGVLIILVPIATAVFQFIQTKMMIPLPAADAPVKKKDEEDFATTFQKQSLYLMPLMIGFFSFRFPIGLSLYWNTFTIFGIIQQYKLQGLGSLTTFFIKDKALIKEVK